MRLYDILGVSPAASTDDIKKAYRRQAMKWHPDRNPDSRSTAEIRFKEIGHAYSVLSDPVKRKAYDEAARDSEAAFQQENPDFTADDAFATFLSAILDLAFSMALHGADQITIYRALTADGCPESIAQMVAKRAHAMANRRSVDTTDSGSSARSSEAPASASSVPPTPRKPQASDDKVEIRKAGPWARFWARTLDVLVMTPAALILLPLMIEAVAGGSSRFAFGMLALLAIAATLLLPFFLDACLVGLFGNSLGKALLGIRVTRKDGCQPGFSDILKRNLYVWGYGYWTGLMPLVSWIPMLMAYRSLTGEKGETKWDAVLGYDVHRTPVGAARIFVFVLSFMVTVLVANLTELTTAHVLSRLASKVGANGNRQSAKLLSDEEVGIKPPTSQPRPGPFDDLIPKKTESGRSEPRFSQSQGWGPWMAQRSVEEISRVAKEYEPRLNDPRAWAAVVAWQSAFIQHWNRLANTAMYDAVGMVSAGLNGNQGICSPDPGDVTIMDAAHATAAMPAGTKSIGYKCAR